MLNGQGQKRKVYNYVLRGGKVMNHIIILGIIIGVIGIITLIVAFIFFNSDKFSYIFRPAILLLALANALVFIGRVQK